MGNLRCIRENAARRQWGSSLGWIGMGGVEVVIWYDYGEKGVVLRYYMHGRSGIC